MKAFWQNEGTWAALGGIVTAIGLGAQHLMPWTQVFWAVLTSAFAATGHSTVKAGFAALAAAQAPTPAAETKPVDAPAS